jgi:hypothetical protein
LKNNEFGRQDYCFEMCLGCYFFKVSGGISPVGVKDLSLLVYGFLYLMLAYDPLYRFLGLIILERFSENSPAYEMSS